MIGIINYGFGNIQAIQRLYKNIHIPTVVVEHPHELEHVQKIILPGVGSFDFAVRALQESGLKQALEQKVLQEKLPLLGICVGMQLLAESSEEGVLPGLGWVPGRVKKFNPAVSSCPMSVPHMGWNAIRPLQQHPLLAGIEPEVGYYFLHSYYFDNQYPEDGLASTEHGLEFTCAVHKGHIYGVQFHPEKSHANGVRLLKNFAELSC